MNKVTLSSEYKTLQQFLFKLGLSEEETVIFITLIQNNQLTILTLARLTGINRTKIYRLVERLEQLGIIQEIIEEHKRYLKTISLNKLELLVSQKEEELRYLRSILPQITSIVPNISSLSQPNTRVIFYRGIEGLKQQGWNTLSANKECVGYTYRVWTEIVGVKFASQWRDEWIRRKLHFREIYSDEYFMSKKQNPKLKGFTYPSDYFEERYIPAKILNINHQMDIYNDVISIYNWHEGEVFGVEIYNEKVANMHKQLFEIVWNIAKTIK